MNKNFPIKDFQWKLLDIYNFNKKGKLSKYFDLIENNLNKEGDYFEAGVFRGHTLLSVALFLKKKGSKKKVYGFDTFSGFPPIYHKNDKYLNYKRLYEKKKITKSHYADVLEMLKIIKLLKKNKSVQTLSSSGNFANNSLKFLKKKIKYLGLDNVFLIKGPFEKTMPYFKKKILGGIIDCDLYKSYKTTFENLWPLMSKKSFLFLDEYYSLKFPGAKIATDEFFQNKNYLKKIYKTEKKDFERCIVIKK